MNGESSPRRPRGSPLIGSRFAHLNGSGGQQNGRRNSGEMTITVGTVSPVMRRKGGSGYVGASVTTVIKEDTKPDATVGTSLLRPASGGPGDAITRSSSHSQCERLEGEETISTVTIGKAEDENSTGQKGQIQQETVKPQVNIQQQSNNCPPTFNPHVPNTPNPHFPNTPNPQVPIIPKQPPEFDIVVKDSDGRCKKYPVTKDTKAEKLMKMIHERDGIHPDQQGLLFAGRKIQDPCKTLGDYGVKKDSEVFMPLRLRGG